MGYIASNPADKVKRPKVEMYIGGFYSEQEINKLFEISKGDLLELPILISAFYRTS